MQYDLYESHHSVVLPMKQFLPVEKNDDVSSKIGIYTYNWV